MVQDIMLDDNQDLMIAAGDFAVAESTQQHERMTIESAKGDWRQFPIFGVDIQRYLNDETPGDLVSAIKTELKNDGMIGVRVKINPQTGDILIDGEYE